MSNGIHEQCPPGHGAYDDSDWCVDSAGDSDRESAGQIAGMADGVGGEDCSLWEYLRCDGSAPSGVCVIGLGDVQARLHCKQAVTPSFGPRLCNSVWYLNLIGPPATEACLTSEVHQAITNHADTASKLSKSISQIADLLPAHSLHLILYPTPQMQTSVARLYAHVLNFFLSSLKWYKDNAAVHAIKSIFQPWDLKFRHEYDAIAAESKQIRRLADVAMKAEVRDTRLEVVQSSKQWDSMRQAVNDLKDENKQLTELLNSRFADMKSSMFCELDPVTFTSPPLQAYIIILAILIRIAGMYQEMRLDFSSQRETLNRVHLNQMLSLPIWDSLPSSGESLQFCRSLRRRNRQLPRLSQLDLNTLEAWSEKQRSSFLLINSSVPVMARTFMVDLIDLILENRLPIIWALRYSDYWDRRTSTTDVMRILLVQCMQLGADRLLDGPFPLTVEQLREAASLDDWVALLSQLLSRVGNAFLVLDAALLEHATSFERCEILEMLEVLRSKLSSNVKIVTSSSMVGRAYTEELESADACFTLNAGDWLDFRKGRTRRQPRRAHQKLDHRPVSR